MTEKHPLIGEYTFKVEPFHADFMGRLTLGTLGNYLLNSAGFHAGERGFGINSLRRDVPRPHVGRERLPPLHRP